MPRRSPMSLLGLRVGGRNVSAQSGATAMSKQVRSSPAESASSAHAEHARNAVGKTATPRSSTARPEIGDTASGATSHGMESVRDLVAALQPENGCGRLAAVKALSRIGGEAVPALVEAMRHKDTRRFAGYALRQIGDAAKEVVPSLIEQLRCASDPDDRCHAAAVLGELGRRPRARHRHLLPRLKMTTSRSNASPRTHWVESARRLNPPCRPYS